MRTSGGPAARETRAKIVDDSRLGVTGHFSCVAGPRSAALYAPHVYLDHTSVPMQNVAIIL